jgi:nicotinamide phosphoribosyltransferase
MGYCTRDNQGSAMKATYVELQETFLPTPESIEYGVRTVGREIFKDPVTDDGTKKSATGLLWVDKDVDGNYILFDKVTWEGESRGYLKTIYEDGKFYNQTTLTQIRERLKNA